MMRTGNSSCLRLTTCFSLLLALLTFNAGSQQPWHGVERSLHYQPSGQGFKLVSGKRRFNRALYGGNTAFRVEAGDLPEFALYLPGMGGNLRLGIVVNNQSKWITQCDSIVARYQDGSMSYVIRDKLLGSGNIQLEVVAGRSCEALLVQIKGEGLPWNFEMISCYGGLTLKKFSRDGDIGADPESSFDLQANDPRFAVQTTSQGFNMVDKSEPQRHKDTKQSALRVLVSLWLPKLFEAKTVEANTGSSPLELFNTPSTVNGAIVARFKLRNNGAELSLVIPKENIQQAPDFEKELQLNRQMAARMKIQSDDPWLNPLAPALSLAADAIWEAPSYLHGAVAWRMRLPGWRGPYVADALAWHDRARQHFSSYAQSQYTEPASGPFVMDTALNLARGLEKKGTSMFSSGYISREPGGKLATHHYDMNLVYIDALLEHLRWTGDTAYLRSMWPVIVRHLDWEKRNFDPDGDHLYDAYAAIWASDALQYSGGGVTHSSAYNYRAFREAAACARLLGLNGDRYDEEADAIRAAVNKYLWMPKQGCYAEYIDALAPMLIHTSPGIWTYYHSIESGLPNASQRLNLIHAALRNLPQIPIKAKGVPDGLYMVSTTDWQPYTWSLNNVVMAEQMNLALAAWIANDPDEAYQLFKSALVESMYLGASPGNFQQLSFYDAIRGELYRDFGDPIGVTSRALVEGLIGFQPDLMHGRVRVMPGFPSGMHRFSFSDPELSCAYESGDSVEHYRYRLNDRRCDWEISLPQRGVLSQLLINGKAVKDWKADTSVAGQPRLLIHLPAAPAIDISIRWKAPYWRPGERLEELREAFPRYQVASKTYVPVDLRAYYNDSITGIFRRQYLSPRLPFSSLELPVQGIGNWAYPKIYTVINDAGLRSSSRQLWVKDIPFDVAAPGECNVIYTSLWDAYPERVVIPVSVQATAAALLMTGTTNAMQAQMVNGKVLFTYEDGSTDLLELRNPENWWPIEQDLMNDGFAFSTGGQSPVRIELATGKIIDPNSYVYAQIKGFSWRAIPGGAASLLFFPLNASKRIVSVTLMASAHDVVIGLAGMAFSRE